MIILILVESGFEPSTWTWGTQVKCPSRRWPVLGFSFLFVIQWFTEKSSHTMASMRLQSENSSPNQTHVKQIAFTWVLRTRNRDQVSKVKTQERPSTHESTFTWRTRTTHLCIWLHFAQANTLPEEHTSKCVPTHGFSTSVPYTGTWEHIGKEIWGLHSRTTDMVMWG